jgi:hypothetical protein
MMLRLSAAAYLSRYAAQSLGEGIVARLLVRHSSLYPFSEIQLNEVEPSH